MLVVVGKLHVAFIRQLTTSFPSHEIANYLAATYGFKAMLQSIEDNLVSNIQLTLVV